MMESLNTSITLAHLLLAWAWISCGAYVAVLISDRRRLSPAYVALLTVCGALSGVAFLCAAIVYRVRNGIWP